MNVRDIFSAAAQDYDTARPRLIPCFDEFYAVALELIPFQTDDSFSVLDLGAGTGLLAAMIAQAFPNAKFTLSDIAPAMLDIARQRFESQPNRFHFEVEDYLSAPLIGGTHAPFDVVVSALSLHHTPPEKLPLVFGKIRRALKPGGIFINADQAQGTSPVTEARFAAMWERGVREAGASEAEIKGALERMEADRTAPLSSQLNWLRGAGFINVECWYKNWRFTVYSGEVAPG